MVGNSQPDSTESASDQMHPFCFHPCGTACYRLDLDRFKCLDPSLASPECNHRFAPPSPRSQSMNLLDPRSSNPAPTEPDRRQHPRYTVQVPIEIRQEDSDLPMRLETTDL